MYTYNTRVSISHVDRNGTVPLYQIMNLLQDCSTFQSEDLGLGVDYLMSQGKAWILIAYKINKIKDLKLGQEICLGTSPTGFKGLMASRQFFIKDMEGNYLVKADTVWVMIDLNTRMVTRASKEDVAMYGTGILFDDVKAKRKLILNDEREAMPAFKVLKTYIDNNGHMNNADYLRAVEEFVPDTGQYSKISITYNKEALEGDMVYPFVSREENGIGICLENKDGEVNARILLEK